MRPKAGRGLFAALLLILALAWAAGHVAATTPSYAGSAASPAMAIDGDTVQLNGQVVQLYGIDAPELGQLCLAGDTWHPCGLAAAHELNKQLRLSRRNIECQPADASGSSERVCFAGNVDVAEALLEAGYVVASATANPDYRELEQKARGAGLGLWQTQFVAPSAWRQGERLAGEPAFAGGCPVKALTTADGQALYFVPTDADYDALALDPARGDRRYCSDESARRDGWRRPGETAAP
jgi:endonuclease YncB( thermonuclease family)